MMEQDLKAFEHKANELISSGFSLIDFSWDGISRPFKVEGGKIVISMPNIPIEDGAVLTLSFEEPPQYFFLGVQNPVPPKVYHKTGRTMIDDGVLVDIVREEFSEKGIENDQADL